MKDFFFRKLFKEKSLGKFFIEIAQDDDDHNGGMPDKRESRTQKTFKSQDVLLFLFFSPSKQLLDGEMAEEITRSGTQRDIRPEDFTRVHILYGMHMEKTFMKDSSSW